MPSLIRSSISKCISYIPLQVLIVLTAGKQTTNQGSFTPLREASKPLQDKGIEIYVVGIGSNKEMDVNEMTQIAGKQENVLTTERFEELAILAEEVSKVACGKRWCKKHFVRNDNQSVLFSYKLYLSNRRQFSTVYTLIGHKMTP